MSLPNPFADERIQFFLRNREDIKAWAAIEADVAAATREVLARSQVAIEERLASLDTRVLVSRHDNGPWERILSRHPEWPEAIGATLEWNKSGDLSGGARPTVGVFWWADPPTLEEPRTRLTTIVDRKELQALGFKVPLGGVWPVGSRVVAPPEWWREPDEWVGTLVDRIESLWSLLAPHIDLLLGVNPQASRG